MNIDPKSDPSFQAIIQNIIKAMRGAPESTPEISQESASDDVTGILIPDSEKFSLDNLVELRMDFVVAHWISSQIRAAKKSSPKWTEERALCFKKFTELRDTNAAQSFLAQDLYFFTRLDSEIYSKMKGSILTSLEDELRLLP